MGEEKFMVGPVSCVKLPSAYGRDGLCVDITPPTAPDTVFRLINVHLDSLEKLSYRTQQLEILAKSCASLDAVVGSSGATSTPSAPGMMSSLTRTDWWMLGSHCTGAQTL